MRSCGRRSRTRTRSTISRAGWSAIPWRPKTWCRKPTRARWARRTSSKPGSNLKAWLFRILRNAFIDRRRRSQREAAAAHVEDLDADGEPAGPALGELQLDQIRALVAEDVAAAVHALAEPFRTVILLDLEGMTEAEVANVLGCATGTVKSRLSRARAVLRERLAAYRP